MQKKTGRKLMWIFYNNLWGVKVFLSITLHFETIKTKECINSMFKYSEEFAWHKNDQVKR